MRYLRLFILPIIIFVTSCSSSTDSLIDTKTMVSILTEIELAEATITLQSQLRIPTQDLLPVYVDRILKKHQVSQSQYVAMMSYYTENPSEYRDVYKEVLEKLSEKQSELAKQ